MAKLVLGIFTNHWNAEDAIKWLMKSEEEEEGDKRFAACLGGFV